MPPSSCKNDDFVRLEGISKHFAGAPALADVDLVIRPGEVHCLVGENGSGKSTLIKILCGVSPPDPDGRIVVDGVARRPFSATDAARLGIQVIYQDLSLFPNLTVAENIGFQANLRRPVVGLADRSTMRRLAEAAMQRVGAALDPDQRVETLPIAHRQIVAICRALAGEARLIIMDEPTASLTRREVQVLLRVVADLGAASVATLFVSHRLTEVLEVADRVTILRDGTKIGTYDASEVDSDRLVRLMTGLSLGAARPRRPRAAFAPARFEVAGLSRAREFHDVSFSVSAGEVVGLTGLLGAGRTELALALFGMTRPDAGCIRLDGTTLRPGSNRDALRHGIAYVPEDRLTLGLVLDHSIASNITVTVLPRLTSRFGLIDRRAYAREVRHWVETLRIKTRDPENPVKTLSGGNQQRVVLAKWIARQPRLLILDSPTVGIDIAAKQEIYEIVDRLAAEGMGVIFISDEISEVLEHTDRILVMREGRIIAEHAATETSEEQLTGYFDA